MPLTPEEQSLFEQLQAKAGSGNSTPAPQGKMNPDEAIQAIANRMAGPQLQRSPEGTLYGEQRHSQPLLGLFGMKQKVPVSGPDYFSSIKEAGLDRFLPTGLPQTPEGTPYVSERTSDQVKQLAANKKIKPDLNVSEFGTRFLEHAGSTDQVEAWKKLTPEAQATLVSSLPAFRTARQDYYTPQGIITDVNGQPSGVSYNAKTGKYEVSPLPTGGQIPGKGRAATPEEIDFFGKAETLNSVMKEVAKFYSDDKVGPFAGRVGRAIDVYTPFTDQERSSLRNNVAKMFNNMVYLRSGKQINQEEAVRMAEEFMNINNTPGAFKSAFDSFQNEFVWLVDNRRKSLRQGLVANADRFAPGVKGNERIQLDGTKAIDSFMSSYDSKHKTSYGTSVRDDAQAATDYLKSVKAKITPANLEWAQKQLNKGKK